MCQVCCRHQWSLSSNPLSCQFSRWAHCWEILFWLWSYSNCLCILCIVSLCFWYHKSFNSIFAFLFHPLSLYAPKNCSCLFLMILSRDLLYPPISISSWFDFFFSPWYSHYSSDVPIAASSLRSTEWSSGRHLASGSGGPRFESWLCQVDVESLGKTLYMHFLTPLMCKTSTRL